MSKEAKESLSNLGPQLLLPNKPPVFSELSLDRFQAVNVTQFVCGPDWWRAILVD